MLDANEPNDSNDPIFRFILLPVRLRVEPVRESVEPVRESVVPVRMRQREPPSGTIPGGGATVSKFGFIDWQLGLRCKEPFDWNTSGSINVCVD